LKDKNKNRTEPKNGTAPKLQYAQENGRPAAEEEFRGVGGVDEQALSI
jgi:hypothetical protein